MVGSNYHVGTVGLRASLRPRSGAGNFIFGEMGEGDEARPHRVPCTFDQGPLYYYTLSLSNSNYKIYHIMFSLSFSHLCGLRLLAVNSQKHLTAYQILIIRISLENISLRTVRNLCENGVVLFFNRNPRNHGRIQKM